MKLARIVVPLAIVLLATSPALAGKKGGVSMPDTLTMYGKTLRLNGMGVREATMFDVDVYVAGLYVEKPSKSGDTLIGGDQVKVLHMMFVRDVDKSDIVDAFKDGFKKNAASYGAVKAKVARLNGWMSGFDDKDTLTLTYRPGKGTKVLVNNETKGTIAGDQFGRDLFAIWLGDHPPNGGLKRGLLGN